MGSTGDKMKGKANEMIGRGKQGLGEATGDRDIKARGQGQELRGKGQQLKGDVKQAIKRGVDDV